MTYDSQRLRRALREVLGENSLLHTKGRVHSQLPAATRPGAINEVLFEKWTHSLLPVGGTSTGLPSTKTPHASCSAHAPAPAEHALPSLHLVAEASEAGTFLSHSCGAVSEAIRSPLEAARPTQKP